jgi:hypothetical protein
MDLENATMSKTIDYNVEMIIVLLDFFGSIS